ncbi:MAG: hypothetical protein ISR98_01765, partial [Parcubacteria group bacterium]|nr:hypothetical protein [Parcubacteria group bacterium]
MKKSFTFKKILPSVLIIAVFSISMFSALGVSTVNAQEETSTTEKIKLVTGVQGLETIGSGLGVVNDAAFGGAKAIYNVGKGAVGIISAAECLSGDGLRGCFAAVGEITLEIFGWILGLTGVALNKTVEITIIQMGANLDKVDTIDAGWKTFRDLANIIIIFSLLYIGIVTILNIEKFNTKKLLASLITAAILINFSMFFAKIIIDSSNLLATNFYKQIQIIGTKGDRDYGVSGHSNWGGISDSYMQAFRFTSLYKIKDGNLDLDNPAINMDVQGVDVATGKIVNRQAVTEIDTNGKPVLNNRQIIFVSLLGSIVFLITAFSFLAVTFLLIVRYAVLILLIMLSPIALAGMILPAMQKYSKMWWSSIISYAFFAPAYLLLTLIIIRMVNSEGFQTAIGFRDINTSVVLIIINFSIIIVLIIASIILSKQMGIWGSDLTIKMGNSARKWGQGIVGRTAIGRPAGLVRQK